jgi:TldD protein
MEAGAKDEKELLNTLNSGLYLASAVDGDVHALTGDFVINIDEAYWVEEGKLKHPVDITEIKGNVMRVLENMVDIGSESTVETSSAICVKPVNLFATQYIPISYSALAILFFNWENKGYGSNESTTLK